jgi:hypothetical protein
MDRASQFGLLAAATFRERLHVLARDFPAQPDAFIWQKNVTPFSDERWVVYVPLAYVLCVVALSEVRTGRTPLRLGLLPALHNALLAFGSALMFAGAASEALAVCQRRQRQRQCATAHSRTAALAP